MEQTTATATRKKKRVDFDLAQFSGDERAKMAEMYNETLKSFTEGAIVKGKVLEVRGNEVLMDVGYKSEGAIPMSEFSDMPEVKPGDEFDVLLVQIEDDNGMVIISKERADQEIRWARVRDMCQEGGVVQGYVKSRVRGGMIVSVDGIEAFLPGSQIDVMPVHNTDPYVGKTFDFKVLKVSLERRNIIVSRRELIEERLKVKRKELLSTISPARSGRAW
jgi:small subunit ribosomal protein S1